MRLHTTCTTAPGCLVGGLREWGAPLGGSTTIIDQANIGSGGVVLSFRRNCLTINDNKIKINRNYYFIIFLLKDVILIGNNYSI